MPPKGKYVKKPKSNKSKKITPKVPIAIKSYVSKALKRGEETKFHSTTYTFTAFNSAINSTPDVVDILPTITHGTTQSGRVGQRIKPIRLEIIGYIAYLTDTNYDAKQIGARLFVYQDKTIKTYSNNSLVNYHLLNLGGTSNTFTGTPMNFLAPTNKDQFTIYADKRYRLQKPFGQTNLGAGASVSNAMAEINSTLFRPFKIILTEKHMPAHLIYDQTESTSYPVNFAPKLSLGYCDLLNNSPDTVTTQLGMAFCATLYYKDA